MFEALAALTATSFLAGIFASLAGRAVPARLLFMATVLFAAIAFLAYWSTRVPS